MGSNPVGRAIFLNLINALQFRSRRRRPPLAAWSRLCRVLASGSRANLGRRCGDRNACNSLRVRPLQPASVSSANPPCQPVKPQEHDGRGSGDRQTLLFRTHAGQDATGHGTRLPNIAEQSRGPRRRLISALPDEEFTRSRLVGDQHVAVDEFHRAQQAFHLFVSN